MRTLAIFVFVAGCWTNSTTPPPAQPIEHRAAPARHTTPPPPPPSAYEELFVQFDAIADRMCSCPDPACANAVTAEFGKWAEEMTKQPATEMTEAEQRRVMDISSRLSDCMMQIMAPQPQPSTP